MREQEQFLHVLDRDEAERRFRAAIDLTPRGVETVPLDAALGRVLAADVISPVDVPSFDRSNVDGFAVVAEDTFGASEEAPRTVQLGEETIHTGVVPKTVIRPGTAVSIATGGMIPRGADAVVMVEYAETNGRELRIARAVTPGSGVTFAGTDITAGETVLRRGQLLTSRDTGVLAAIGVAAVDVWRKPIVAILSTGDEIIAPGEPMQPAKVYDSNAQVLADAVRELGGEPKRLGITHDDMAALRGRLQYALECCRCRAPLRRHEQGRGRSVVSRRRRTARSRHRRPRRRAQAGQADLPGGDSRPPGRRAPRLSDVGDFHVSRVRGAGASASRRPGRAGADRRAGATGGEGQQRDRADRVPAGRAGRDGGRTKRRERRSPRIRWDRGPAASRRSVAPTVSRRSAGTTRLSRPARSSTCSCSAGICSWPTSW